MGVPVQGQKMVDIVEFTQDGIKLLLILFLVAACMMRLTIS